MSTYTETEYDEDEIDATEADDNSPKGLRRAAGKSKKLESELAQAKRELAFAKAGIDPDDPRMKYFVKGYDGDLTAGAVRQAAVEAGFIQDSQQDEHNQAVQQAAASQQRVMKAASGAIVEDASEEAAYARLQQAMDEGGVDAMLQVAREYGIPTTTEQ